MQPWFKLYAADYLLDDGIFDLEPEAVGLLVAMWCLCWRDGFAPADSDLLARKARLRVAYVRRRLPSVKVFFREQGCVLISERLERERSESESENVKKVLAGKVGAAARWEGKSASKHPETLKSDDADANADANGTRNAFQSQSQSQKKQKSSANAAVSSPWEDFAAMTDSALWARRVELAAEASADETKRARFIACSHEWDKRKRTAAAPAASRGEA